MEAPIAKRLEGKVAIVTGGASGLGKATATLFLRHGAKVVIADVQDKLGELVARELGTEDNVIFIHCNMVIEDEVKNLVDTTVAKYGKLDIMYNNAAISGGMSGTRVLESENDEFRKVMDVNVFGPFLGAKHAARVMVPAKKGTIIFTSSVQSLMYAGGSHAYNASKHAVLGLCRSLCSELGEYGIRVNCVAPYTVATPMVTSYMNMSQEEVEEIYGSAVSLKGVALKPEDIADAVLYLASDESKYVSGLNLLVDGGCTVANPLLSVHGPIIGKVSKN